MDEIKDVKKILCEQLELLAEYSKQNLPLEELVEVTSAMVSVSKILIQE